MVSDTITGSRIRERRVILGMKQAELARRAGISPSYLNLIEHNRRRIGGKLLADIAAALGVAPTVLSEGAEAALTAALREAAALSETEAEVDRVEEFASRFPGWARLLDQTHARTIELAQTVQTLSDRLTHDPHLAASLHEMLSTVTAIHSTASILAEPGQLEPEWLARFHRNINEDSARLAETSQSLVAYLDTVDDANASATTPQDEVDAMLVEAGFAFPSLEAGEETPEAATGRLAGELSDPGRRILLEVLRRYHQDARALPLAELIAEIECTGLDPLALSSRFGCDPARAMRRLAVLSATEKRPAMGLAVCDSSGALLFRKPVDGFPLPRHGTGCSLLPLYAALHRPGVVISELLRQSGQQGGVFRTYAYAVQITPAQINRTPLYQAHMLIVPEPTGALDNQPPTEVGVTCRICPRASCPGRREPSILSEEVNL